MTKNYTLRFPPEIQKPFEEVAKRVALFWGDEGSGTKLVRAIASHLCWVATPDHTEWLERQRISMGYQTIDEFMNEMIDDGGSQPTWLPSESVRMLRHVIELQEPFIIDPNAKKRTVRYAELVTCYRHNRKVLLMQAWCDEINEMEAIEELQHNHLIDLDSLKFSLMQPSPNSAWLEDQASIEVTFEVKSQKYYKHNDDISVTPTTDGTVVVRRITSSELFFEDILPYSSSCQIKEPAVMRSHYCKVLARTLEANS